MREGLTKMRECFGSFNPTVILSGAVSSDNMPDGDFLTTDSASPPSESTDLFQALEKALLGLTDVLAPLGNDRPHPTLCKLAQVDVLFLSLGVKDLTWEDSHNANDLK
jgi:hypothetical protein